MLIREIYAEVLCEGAVLAMRGIRSPLTEAPDAAPPSAPVSAAAHALLRSLSIVVAGVGALESVLLFGTDGLPCREIREATADELSAHAGTLAGTQYLPSAYDPWVGPRPRGVIRLRYGFDGAKLLRWAAREPEPLPVEQLELACRPVQLDPQTEAWVRSRLSRPAAPSRLAVWRALKRRMYHYDAGVLAFKHFPRNYLLSPDHWAELLRDRPRGKSAIALDVGAGKSRTYLHSALVKSDVVDVPYPAGDGSLCDGYKDLFSTVVVTELTDPLVARLRTQR